MASQVIETSHKDTLHDTQLDYYGRFLATASSDRTVSVFAVAHGNKQLIATLTGHEGPVWMVDWAHPKFGNVLASCSYDHRAIVWKEGQPTQQAPAAWKPVHIIDAHTASVNAVAWAPHEYGLMLATASSDGHALVSSCLTGSWQEPTRVASGDALAHPMGAMGLSWAPYQKSKPPLLATCGCDCKTKIWRAKDPANWELVSTFADHKDWVRDVAFSPDATSSYDVVATCSQDKKVVISRRKRDASDDTPWEKSTATFEGTVWRLSWSPCGTMILVTTGENLVFMLKEAETFTDEWARVPVDN